MQQTQTLAAAPHASLGAIPDTDDTERACSILARAFAHDPPCRWLFPDDALYASAFPSFALALGGAAFGERTLVAHEHGAALWLAPEAAGPDEEALVALVGARVAERRREATFAILAEMDAHHPAEPHWYLPLVGVAPERQGGGIGAALLAPVLERCDATGVRAYLEASTERSRRLYERMGFEATGVIRVADCPPIVPMLREPRAAA